MYVYPFVDDRVSITTEITTVSGRRSKTRERAHRLPVHQENDEQNPRPDGLDSRAEEEKLLEAVRIQRGVVLRLIVMFGCV